MFRMAPRGRAKRALLIIGLLKDRAEPVTFRISSKHGGLAAGTDFAYSPSTMSDHKEGGAGHHPWTLRAANLLEMSESVVLVVIGVALVLVAVLLLYSSVYDLNE